MNSRSITNLHLKDEVFRTCRVCQYAIDQDHAEALRENDEVPSLLSARARADLMSGFSN